MATSRPACAECRLVNERDAQICEGCRSTALTDDWSGYAVITHPNESEIADLMGVEDPGAYALKVRR